LQDWQGNGQEVFITMDDGTEFVRLPTASATDTLLRSPAGGSDGTTAWTTQYSTTNALGYSILVRDPTNDTALHFVATGSSFNWSLRCRAISSTGTVLADVTMPYNGFLEGLSTNPYIRGGVEPTTGKFVLVQAAQYWGGASMQRTQTLQNVMYIMRGKFTKTSSSTGTFAFEERKQLLMPERTAYHIPLIGLNGDPDFMCGLAGRDVLITEDTDYATGLKGSFTGGGSGWYNFDQVGYFWYNFRTRDSGFKWITPRTGFLTSDCLVRATWASSATSITIDEIVSGTIRRGQKVAATADNSGNTQFIGSYIGSSAGTVGTAVPIVTTFGGTTAVAGASASGTKVLLRLVEDVANIPTPWARYAQAIPSNDGYIWFVYARVRHDASATVALNAKTSYRIVKMSAYGDVVFDEEFISEFSTGSSGSISFGNHTLIENSNNQKYIVRIANGPNQTQFHFCKVKETLTNGSTTTASSTSGSQDVTIPAGATGDWYPGMYVYGSAWSSGFARITNWKTYTPGGSGTIVVDSNANSTVSGTLSLTSRGVVGVEPPIAGNSINGPSPTVGWGTNTTYLGIAQTLPARASGFLAWTCDDRSGSRVRKFRVKCAVSRKVNDHPTNTSGTNDQKIDMVNVRLP
jgi:hypothetical protein